ncbi:PAS domain S-box protein, partial [Candidatus Woesearchaeota archaeon]|nr:PAS domain S-box protein [Candidatus Woesearchaeota archaeon]
LFENANDLIQCVDKDGNFVYVNKKWKQALGYSDKEIKNFTFRDIISKEHLPMCNKIFKQIIQGKVFDKIETEFITKQGKKIYVEGNINSYSKDNKFFTRGIFRDITDRKKSEQNLLKLKEKYEKDLQACKIRLKEYKAKLKK